RLTDRERAADGGRADRALHDGGSQVAWPELPRRGVEPCQLVRRQPDDDVAVEHADRRRHGTRLPDPPPRGERHLGALPGRGALRALTGREAVRDERRLERDDRPRLAHLIGDADHGMAPSRATQRAAASSPASTPPTRKPAAKASPAPVGSTTSVSTAAYARP